jgi:hydrogenase maturation protein HypF
LLDQHDHGIHGLRIRIEGSVQGVGFRPWVHGLASRGAVRGRVWNDGGAVTIEAFADRPHLENFLTRLLDPPMPAARVLALRSEPIPAEYVDGFTIVPSTRGRKPPPAIPPDLATCSDCLHELGDPHNRRYGYAFTNCTRCGPRYTIATGTPYDRDRTSMVRFAMCEACRTEYEDVADRRFHAQPNACPDCGPRLQLVSADGSAIVGDPIERTAALLRAGRIVAVKGLGGYHLACDASSPVAVELLRRRKQRYAKPLAVMVASLAAAEQIAALTPAERDLLSSAARPIVLVRRRAGAALAPSVAPDTPLVGLLLPYTPLHELLLRAFGRALVMTSGNISDEPMTFDDDAALSKLGGNIADVLLRHDRPIVARCDDSITRVLDGAPVVLRRARGWVPASLEVSHGFSQPVLACGAHMKNAFCLGAGRQAWMGPHVGDLETDDACTEFEESVERFSRFVGIAPAAVAHDLHPDYFTTRWARSHTRFARVAVQHHHAHVVSLLTESGVEGPVYGLAWDGTGDGGDGTAWGGELLAADRAGFVRVATLRPVPLAGADAAIREVWRIALALVDDAFDGDPPLARLRLFDAIDPERVAIVRRMIASRVHAPLAHGAGRYFDALGAIVLGRAVSRYEGEVASAFGFAAGSNERGRYAFDIDSASALRESPAPPVTTIDLRPAVRAAVIDALNGVAAASIAGRFHATLAAVADAMVRTAERTFGVLPVVMSGGCFQNERLVSNVTARLAGRTRVIRHQRVPPNDGGLALGQAVIAATTLAGEGSTLGDGAIRARIG